MARTQAVAAADGLHPIDVVETVADHHDWDFDRLADNQITMTVQGQWRSYALTLSWSAHEAVLRLICAFEMDPPADRLPLIYETLNLSNDQVWDGGFAFWSRQRLMVWRYGLVLGGDAAATGEQVERMIGNALVSCERFYPSFQLVAWGNARPDAALDMALGKTYGRA